MKKILFAAVMLLTLGAGSLVTYAKINNMTVTAAIRYITMIEITGDRVILRSGPGKNYPQVRYDDGTPVYYMKGQNGIPGRKGVKNGYRHFEAIDSDATGWVSTRYSKVVKVEDDHVY